MQTDWLDTFSNMSFFVFAAMVIVAKYFDERRSFAVGIACCGSGIGTLVFAEFIEFLINDAQLSWRDTFQVLTRSEEKFS